MEDLSGRIAFIIPAHNEELCIKATLEALINSGANKEHIFVVDDCSTDSTRQLAIDSGVNVFTTEQNAGNKAGAIQAGLRQFSLIDRYDWIAFMDGDTIVDREFYHKLQQSSINNASAGIIEGQVLSAKNPWIYSAARSTEYFLGHALHKGGQHNFKVIYVSPGCVSMFRTSVLAQCRLERDTLAEDMDLTLQVHSLGYDVVYDKQVKVFTQDPATFNDYYKQITRWHRGFWQIVKKYKVLSLKKKTRVEWFMLYTIADSFVFNKFLWIAIASMLSSSVIAGLVLDYIVSLFVAVLTSCYNKRIDTLYKHPVYYWLTYVNVFAYFKAFVDIMLKQKQLLSWNKVARRSV